MLDESAIVEVRPYRLPFHQRVEIDSQIEKLSNEDIIQESISPFNSPLLLVPKKSNSDNTKKWRVVVDFRHLNSMSQCVSFPLPNVIDILDQLGSAKYFSTLDLPSGYHQVQLNKNDRHKTAFSTNKGHYEFVRMPFGLKNAPATFQRLMNIVLSGLDGIECFVYLDDIVVFGSTLSEHNARLTNVFDRFRNYNLKLGPLKCNFLSTDVIYLGHRITTDGIYPDPEKTKVIRNFPTPKTVKNVRSFLGLCGYYRRFIKNFALHAKPLNDLLKKDTRFNWTPFCQESFEFFRNKLINPPILQYPDFSREFILTTDASKSAIGAVLSQGEPSKDLPIAYASRTMNKHEINYSVTEKELLAITWAVKHFRPYLFGKHFTIYCDHKPLIYLMNVKDPSSRLLRFRIKLDEYDYSIIHKAGKINTNADALSRMYPVVSKPFSNTNKPKKRPRKKKQAMPDSTTSVSSIDFSLTLQDHQYTTSDDDSFSEIEDHVSNFNVQPSSNNISNFRNSQNPFIFNENNFQNDQFSSTIDPLSTDNIATTSSFNFNHDKESSKISPTPEEIPTILYENHDTPFGGHQGVLRTYKKIKSRYSWKGMLGDIRKYVSRCPVCQKSKPDGSVKMPLQVTTTSDYIFEKITVDIVGPLPVTHRGNKYLLTIQDDLSKFLVITPIPRQDAATISRALCKHFINIFGTPKIILTDQGKNLISGVFKELCKCLGISKINSTAYRPQTQGALERSHRTLNEYLRSFISAKQTNWDELSSYAAFCFNTSVSSSSRFTPYELVFGHSCRIPTSISRSPSDKVNSDKVSETIINELRGIHKLAKENQIHQKIQRKTYFDKKAKPLNFLVGNKVLLKDDQPRLELNKKLCPVWLGPYEVLSTPTAVNTKIMVNNRPVLVHNNRLKNFKQ